MKSLRSLVALTGLTAALTGCVTKNEYTSADTSRLSKTARTALTTPSARPEYNLPAQPSFEEKKRIALEHIRLEVQYEGEKTGILQSRKIAAWYFKGCPNVAQLRNKTNRAASLEEMTSLILDFRP